MSASPRPPSSSAAISVRRPRGFESCSSDSRSAAIGVMRVARSAGASAATSVTTIPISSETITVRASSTVPVLGRSAPIALKSALMPAANRIPAASPATAPSDAEHERLDPDGREDLPARGAERAQHAELARALGDRDREGVEDLEGAHEQRDPGEHEQRDPQEAEVARDVVRLALRRLFAGLGDQVGRQDPGDPVAQLGRPRRPRPRRPRSGRTCRPGRSRAAPRAASSARSRRRRSCCRRAASGPTTS